METGRCTSCVNTKAPYTCGKCQGPICKTCVQSLQKNSFPYLNPTPEDLTHKEYCVNCYSSYVGPALDNYNDTIERAKRVMVFHKGLSEETRLMSRAEKPLKLEGCEDKADATLRLAFLAAQKGFNSLIDVDVSPRKIRNAGFQTTKWRAIGVPLTLDEKKYELKKK